VAYILLAEDDMAVRDFIARALPIQGHNVLAVGDGEAALRELSGGRFNLLLTDVVMPGMDGFELSKRVATHYPGLPILLMTGYSAERERAHNLDGVDAQVITKPFTLQSLCRSIDDVLSTPALQDVGKAPCRTP
jgi:CheY-like chemotaxis protein